MSFVNIYGAKKKKKYKRKGILCNKPFTISKRTGVNESMIVIMGRKHIKSIKIWDFN